MTILDVLRYDPLYSWSLSPLRLRKVQDAQNEPAGEAAGVGGGGGGGGAAGEEPGRKDEPGEADRALTVVAKKLSKSLSVTATVNELIQQATDERNLAVLVCLDLSFLPPLEMLGCRCIINTDLWSSLPDGRHSSFSPPPIPSTPL